MALESQGTKLEMGTGTGGAVATVTAAVGFPTIITKNSHGLTNGDVVALTAFAGADAATMNGNTVVIKNVTTNTLAVDINTIGMTLTAANGTLTPVALTEIGEITDISREDPGASEIDVTHLQSDAKEYLMGLEDAGTVSLSLNWLFADAGQEAVLVAKTARTKKSFKITYSDDSTMSFDAYVKTFSGPSASVDGKLAGTLVLKIDGAITIA